MKVKEIINYQNAQEDKINEWLSKNPEIEIIDIKYSVGTFQESDNVGDAEAYSGVLILYKEPACCGQGDLK